MKLNYDAIDDITFDGIDHNDYPDYCDAYIDFRQVYICEGCAATIFLQQASWYARQNPNKTKKFIIGTDPY